MIVLDEQLSGRNLETQIAHWYQGAVCFALSDSRAREIPARLRSLFDHPLFDTKKKRMGKVVRVAEKEASYYSMDDTTIRTID